MLSTQNLTAVFCSSICFFLTIQVYWLLSESATWFSLRLLFYSYFLVMNNSMKFCNDSTEETIAPRGRTSQLAEQVAGSRVWHREGCTHEERQCVGPSWLVDQLEAGYCSIKGPGGDWIGLVASNSKCQHLKKFQAQSRDS
jgi:hypothetical protein